MTFDVDRLEDQPKTFGAEHEIAVREIQESGLKFTRFTDVQRSSVLYLLRIDSVMMNIDEINGLLFFESMPVPFCASRYYGHMATEIKIERADVPSELQHRKVEVMNLLSEGLETYRLWFASAFWMGSSW